MLRASKFLFRTRENERRFFRFSTLSLTNFADAEQTRGQLFYSCDSRIFLIDKLNIKNHRISKIRYFQRRKEKSKNIFVEQRYYWLTVTRNNIWTKYLNYYNFVKRKKKKNDRLIASLFWSFYFQNMPFVLFKKILRHFSTRKCYKLS